MISHIEKITVLVDSQAAAKQFWTEQVGFVVTMAAPMPSGADWLEVAPAADSATTLILYPRSENPEQLQGVGHPQIMFASDDAPATWAQLKANGVDVSPIDDNPYGQMFHFQDQEGQSYTVHG